VVRQKHQKKYIFFSLITVKFPTCSSKVSSYFRKFVVHSHVLMERSMVFTNCVLHNNDLISSMVFIKRW